MTQITIPVTTYQVRSAKPNRKYGSPGALFIGTGGQVFVRVPLDRIPLDATITSVILQVYEHRAVATELNVRAFSVTSPWTSSITWNKRPSVGSQIASVTKPTVAQLEVWQLDITSWGITRSRNGIRVDTTGTNHLIRGSAAGTGKMNVLVEYDILPAVPGTLTPDGGAVSVDRPILTYAGDEEMTLQRIEYSTDGGVTVAYATAWLPATEGYFDPATDPATPTAVAGGSEVLWRATTEGPNGTSAPSEWASYTYAPLPTVTILSPGPTSADGSPPLQWTVDGGAQTAWMSSLESLGTVRDSTQWRNEPTNFDWTPDKGVAVPDTGGLFTLKIKDDVSPRVSAVGAPSDVTVTHQFITTLDGTGAPIDSLELTFEEPIPVLSGTRADGVPDYVSLYRDGVQVPLWSPIDETFYSGWAPGADFFTAGEFVLRDYTADLRQEHTWTVRTRTNGVVSTAGPSVSEKFTTGCVWLVDPRTGRQVEVQGYNGLPVVEQTTEESSILHTPLNGGLIVESIRRRIIRTTRSGTVSGLALGDHEQILDDWITDDSGLHYRLIFGKVNWSVIIGDYSPTDVFYPVGQECEPGYILIAANWWQRLEDD